ncbi:MAG: nucleoside triphosphate pyrophosphohydrolase [Pseudomonadota bacterium]
MINILLDLVKRLRGDNGCPWDKKQTPDTVKRYLIEEAYEAVEAIEQGVADQVCEELGDLLFQIVFLIRLYEEKGAFFVDDVIRLTAEKMIRRHPHVFGDEKVKDAEEVKEKWHKIKLEENGSNNAMSLFDSIPRSLPALMRGHRVIDRAVQGRVVDIPLQARLFEQAGDFLARLEREGEDSDCLEEMFGDFFLVLVQLSRYFQVDAEAALRKSIDHFIGKM